MNVTCERCNTEYDFDDTLVSGRGTTVKCTNCGHLFKVRKSGDPAAAPEKWVVRTVDGRELQFNALRELQAAITQRTIGREDVLSRGSSRPRRLGAISELEPFFTSTSAPAAPHVTTAPGLGATTPLVPTRARTTPGVMPAVGGPTGLPSAHAPDPDAVMDSSDMQEDATVVRPPPVNPEQVLAQTGADRANARGPAKDGSPPPGKVPGAAKDGSPPPGKLPKEPAKPPEKPPTRPTPPKGMAAQHPEQTPPAKPPEKPAAKPTAAEPEKPDRIGVVVFGKSAYVLSPPTLDYHLLTQMVSKMTLNVIDGSATAIGDAVGTAAARLRRSDAQSKVVLLLTDGDSNAGSISPEYATHLATTVGAKVYTIQIGTDDEVDVEDGTDLFGQPRYVRHRFPVNPALLQRISNATGGKSYVATDAKALADSMHAVLDQLEKTRFEASIASFEDLFPFLLVPGVLLIGLDALLRSLLLRRFP